LAKEKMLANNAMARIGIFFMSESRFD